MLTPPDRRVVVISLALALVASVMDAMAGSFSTTVISISYVNSSSKDGNYLTTCEKLPASHWCSHGDEVQKNAEPGIILWRGYGRELVLKVVERIVDQKSRCRDESTVVLTVHLRRAFCQWKKTD